MHRIATLLASVIAAVAVASPLQADLADRREHKTETLLGGSQLAVVVDYSSGLQRERLALNGIPIAGVEAQHVHIRDDLRFSSGPGGVWRLIRLESGDLACPSLWAIVVINKAESTATPPFGTCADRLLSADEDDGTWVVTMDRLPLRKDQPAQAYMFDGTTVTALAP